MTYERRWYIKDPSSGAVLEPQPHQEAFAESDSFATFFAGGWGSGKSYALLAWLSRMAWINPPKTSGLVIMPTHSMLREFLESQLMPAFAPIIEGWSKIGQYVILPGGRRLLYRSGFVPERIEQVKVAYVGIDEAGLLPKKVFTRAVARIRDVAAKQIGIGLVGVPVWGWMKDEFDGKNDKKRRIIHASTTDNKMLHPDMAENLRESCSSRDATAYIHGHFVPPGGSVYPEIGERHLTDWSYSPDLETIVVIDWSPRRYHVLFVQLLPVGTTINGVRLPGTVAPVGAVVYDELYPNSDRPVTTEALCQLIRAKGYRLDALCCDPAGSGIQATSGIDEITIAKRVLGLTRVYATTRPALRSIPNGLDHVRRMLDPLTGPPLLYFAKTLTSNNSPRAVWYAMQAYSYPKAKDGKPIGDVPEKEGIAEDACFVAGTMIATPGGLVPIENIRIGDYVTTREGPRLVLASGQTGIRVVDKYRVGNIEMCCTESHNVISLNSDGSISKQPIGGLVGCQSKLCFLAECTEGKNIATTMSGEPERGLYIGTYGLHITGRSQKDITSITKTETTTTTTSKTLNASKRMSICQCTQANTTKTTQSGQNVECERSKTRQKIGTDPKMEDCGTLLMQKKYGKICQSENENVNIAEMSIQSRETCGQDFVQTGVKLKVDMQAELMMNQEFAWIVAEVSCVTSTEKKKSVMPVYNIEVENAHEYFANGLLVANCDATRYLAINFFPVVRLSSSVRSIA